MVLFSYVPGTTQATLGPSSSGPQIRPLRQYSNSISELSLQTTTVAESSLQQSLTPGDPQCLPFVRRPHPWDFGLGACGEADAIAARCARE